MSANGKFEGGKGAHAALPPIISIESPVAGGRISVAEPLLWPCLAVSVPLPVLAGGGLNVFEETALGLAAAGLSTPEAVSDESCIPLELCAFLFKRLAQMKLLGKGGVPTRNGLAVLAGQAPDGNANEEPATMFMDIATGKVLPFAIKGSPRIKRRDRTQSGEGMDAFYPDPKKPGATISAIVVDEPDHEGAIVQPESADLTAALKEYRRRLRTLPIQAVRKAGFLTGFGIPRKALSPSNCEKVLMHCTAVMEEGGTDLLITDGTGLRYDEDRARYAAESEFTWIDGIKRKGIEVAAERKEQSSAPCVSNQDDRWTELDGNVRAALASIRNYRSLLESAQSATVAEAASNEQMKITRSLYSALEWAFREAVREYEQRQAAAGSAVDPKTIVSEFPEDDRACSDALCAMAAEAGFLISDDCRQFLRVTRGKAMSVYHDGDEKHAELQPLVAVSLVEASHNQTQPICDLAAQDSGFLKFVSVMKHYRDAASHGDTSRQVDPAELEEARDRTLAALSILVPEYAVPENADDAKPSLQRQTEQEGLAATLEIERAFGSALAGKLSDELLDAIKKMVLTRRKLERGEDAGADLTGDAAAVLQIAFFDAASEAHAVSGNGEELKQKAFEAMAQAGYCGSAAELPPAVTTVRARMVEKACAKGTSQTLGANLLRLFIVMDGSFLKELHEKAPGLVEAAARAASLRVHNNTAGTSVPAVELVELAKNVFNTVKELAEIKYGH